MKLKDRFRKGLFAFFKEEILEAVTPPAHSLGDSIERNCIVERKIPYMIATTLDIDEERDIRAYGVPANIIFEKRIGQAREKLFEEFVKFVDVDSADLLRPDLYGRRRVRLSIFVGKTIE